MVFGFGRSKNDKQDWQAQWREAVSDYAANINGYTARGFAEGWEGLPDPEDIADLSNMPEKALAVAREANARGETDGLLSRLPPTHRAFGDFLEAGGQNLPGAIFLPDNSIVLRAGSPYQDGEVWHIEGDTARPLGDGIIYVGRSPDRSHYAIVREDGIRIHKGWNGPETAFLSWPTGLEDLPETMPGGVTVEPMGGPYVPTQLIPYPDGQRALLVASAGIYVLTEAGARRLYPTKDSMLDMLQYIADEDGPGATHNTSVSMEHGAVSPDGRYLMAGHQDEGETLYDANTLKPVGSVQSWSEYPHYALFSDDSAWVMSNRCHFYNGHTVCAPTSLFPTDEVIMAADEGGVSTNGAVTLHDGARVYAATTHGNVFYIGDAYGYIYACRTDGELLWRHHIGSSFSSLDITPDGKTLLASTYAGFLAILDLENTNMAPWEIGTGGAREIRRWVFWKNEDRPLLWG